MSFENILKPKTHEEIDDLAKRGFLPSSGKWRFCIDISELIADVAKTKDLLLFKNSILALLKTKVEDIALIKSDRAQEKLLHIITEFENLGDNPTVTEIDDAVNHLYDWGDDKDIWIKSFPDDEDEDS